MNKHPCILIVHNYYQLPGGEDTVVENEKRLLEAHGHKVILYTRNNNELKTLNIFSKIFLPVLAIFNIRTYKDIRKIIQSEQVEIVHVHNTLSLVSPSVYYAALSKHIPVVQTVHNFRLICPGALLYCDNQICERCIYGGLKWALRYGCYRGSKIQTLIVVLILKIHRITGIYRKLNYICLTEFNKNKLLEGNGKNIFDKKRLYVKPNFSLDYKEIIPYKDRKKQFVYIGRPERVKGIDVILKAWKEIKEFRLIICGTSNEIGRIKEYVQSHQMENVVLLGRIDNSKVKEILSESLALIMPTQWYEGFPMVIAESYSCGTPVIGSDIGNTGILIIDGKTGYRFKHDSSEDLCEKVYELGDMTEKCHRFFKENFSMEINYNMLAEIYYKILSEM